MDRDEAKRNEFEEAALPHLDVLYGTAVKMTRNPSAAEDLVQDTMIRAYRFFSHYEKGTNCKAWLFTILRNAFVNRYRKSWRDSGAVPFETIEEHSEGAVLAPLTAQRRSPEESVADARLATALAAALDRLPAEFRTTVVLSIVEGYSYKEVASIMSCPIGTVMSRVHRGRKLLQTALQGQARERGLFGGAETPLLIAGRQDAAAGSRAYAV